MNEIINSVSDRNQEPSRVVEDRLCGAKQNYLYQEQNMCLKMSPSDELVAVIHKPQDPCKDVSLDFARRGKECSPAVVKRIYHRWD